MDRPRVARGLGVAALIFLPLIHAVQPSSRNTIAPVQQDSMARPEASVPGVTLPPPPAISLRDGGVRSPTPPAPISVVARPVGALAQAAGVATLLPHGPSVGQTTPSETKSLPATERNQRLASGLAPPPRSPVPPAAPGSLAITIRAAHRGGAPTPAFEARAEVPGPAGSTVALLNPRDRIGPSAAAMLRLAEHGDGPAIEIEWPQAAADRAALERVLRRCYGMRDARVLLDGRLIVDRAGLDTATDDDRYSRLARLPGDGLPAAMASRLARNGGASVRVFPRRLDAALLEAFASLQRTAGHIAIQTITGRYRQRGNALSIVDLRVDGARVVTEIDLNPLNSACLH
ncbi:MAG: hypothetical protein RID42_16050 [Alphaproteobacteria bacterium]